MNQHTPYRQWMRRAVRKTVENEDPDLFRQKGEPAFTTNAGPQANETAEPRATKVVDATTQDKP